MKFLSSPGDSPRVFKQCSMTPMSCKRRPRMIIVLKEFLVQQAGTVKYISKYDVITGGITQLLGDASTKERPSFAVFSVVGDNAFAAHSSRQKGCFFFLTCSCDSSVFHSVD